MTITDYHAKYLAYELTRRHASDSQDKFAGTLVDAQVDPNPHQIDAALFAFNSPLASGALLADEVGLGKTIEAGLVISQKWAERKRRILIIVPASLRKQWLLELQEKFFLSSIILETKSYNTAIRNGNLRPFESEKIVICSYEFVRRHPADVNNVPWDLVVLDEAHRLRNVYRENNLTANIIKNALGSAPKLLLTATPLQNSLNELYGLVSLIDPYTFGDLESFRIQFGQLQTDEDFQRLRERIKPVCHRTLRKQVLPYIKYTQRRAILEEFNPDQREEELYNAVSEYLRQPKLMALPNSQRALITMVLRKLLASSTFAIASALEKMSDRLARQIADQPGSDSSSQVTSALAEDFETWEELEDEDEDDEKAPSAPLTEVDRLAIRAEIDELRRFITLARSIDQNAKGRALLKGLDRAFAEAAKLGAARKAIIFTESRKTQDYLLDLLGKAPEFAEGIVLFNGSNSDPDSRRILAEWQERNKGTDRVTGSRTADMRSALVDYFCDQGQIMIATESAAEGINLQFCSLVVNYDLPWNPQRIEQRIGRCHRYGQKHDVVVLNFLNKKNEADARVYELLEQKFHLFEGVFGASDEVLGQIESGISFEKRIGAIYQECRTPDEIDSAFRQLQFEFKDEIEVEVKRSNRALLDNFDDEVTEKLRKIEATSGAQISAVEKRLMDLTRHELANQATFLGDGMFEIDRNPFQDRHIPTGRYELPRRTGDAHVYRTGHPLAEAIIEQAKQRDLPPAELAFDLSGGRVTALDQYRDSSGWLKIRSLTMSGGAEVEDSILIAAVTDDGQPIDEDLALRLFLLPSTLGPHCDAALQTDGALDRTMRERERTVIDHALARSSTYLDQEEQKLDNWADDRKRSLRQNMHDIDKEIRELKREEKLAGNMPEKIAIKRKIQQANTRRDDAEMDFRQHSRDVDKRKDELLDQVEQSLFQQDNRHDLFTIRWTLQ